MKNEYLRCPVCGKLSRVSNFQVHHVGGEHNFPEIMVQEIHSEGRGKIRNRWYTKKLDREAKQKLKTFFGDILRRVLDYQVIWDGILEEEKKAKEETGGGKWIKAKVKDERDEIIEMDTIEDDDELLLVEEEDSLFAVEDDDESFAVEVDDERIKVL